MGWRLEGRLAVVVHGAKNPSNLEWQGLLRDEAARDSRGDWRTLIVSYGGGPDGPQRALLAQQIGGRPVPTCVMTGSPLVRAIAAALLFFNRTMKVVGIDERDRAYDFLGLHPDEREQADRLRAEVEHELGLRTSLRPAAPRGRG
jgi:hypothetical protein